MTNVRPEVYRAIQDNDLSAVVFADPLSNVTRQAKRNLLIASFIALLIAVLQLEVTGFLGLKASKAELGNLLAQGLACLVVVYFLISASVHLFVDYSAWQFQRERQATQPYLELISLFEQQVAVTKEHIDDACGSMNGIVIESDMRSQVEAKKDIGTALSKLNSIDQRIAGLVEETQPLIESWVNTIKSMNRLNTRLRMRFLSLWCLDILFPIVLALFAIWSTADGVMAVIAKIAS